MAHKRTIVFAFAGVILLCVPILWLAFVNAHISIEQRINAAVMNDIVRGVATEEISALHYQTSVIERCVFGFACRSLTAVRVYSAHVPIRPDALARLLRLRRLEILRLTGETIDSDAVGQLQRMPDLRHLHCINCTIEGSAPTSEGPQLIVLDLTSSKASLSTLEALIYPGTIQELHLAEFEVESPIAMIDIVAANLSELHVLDVSYSELTDDAAIRIREIRSLRELNLDHTEITDVTLYEIAELEHLEILRVSDTDVTNRGIRALARIESLRELQVKRCAGITQDVIAWLKEAKPGLTIQASY